ncbi:MAG: hypothetical protein QM608_07025 [Caulobacter sp.]
MSTASVQPPLRAPLRLRLWTWAVSVILTYAALGVPFGAALSACYWFGRKAPGIEELPPWRLLGVGPPIDASPLMGVAFVGWLVAWGLHVHASRRRRMSILHAIAPLVMFALGCAAAFRTATACLPL